MVVKIGIADTMFARVDMYAFAEQVIREFGDDVVIERYTVPGFKDLPVACKKLIEEYDCSICLALGMAGDAPIDEVCAHEASQGLIQAQLMTNTHILGVFVHMSECNNDDDLFAVCQHRTAEHTKNALTLIAGKTALSRKAGQGVRQGRSSVGPVATPLEVAKVQKK